VGLIYLDSCLVIYLVERHPILGDAVAPVMTGPTEARFGISPLVKCECLVGALNRGDAVLKRAYGDLSNKMVLLEMPEPIFLRAAALHAPFGLRTPDALHLACAQHHGCDELWTNDDRLAQASGGLGSEPEQLNRLVEWRSVHSVMPTQCLPRAKAGVGIHVFSCCDQQDMDGGPSPAMTGWVSTARYVKQLSRGGPLARRISSG
jgi:uncharacterized protein